MSSTSLAPHWRHLTWASDPLSARKQAHITTRPSVDLASASGTKSIQTGRGSCKRLHSKMDTLKWSSKSQARSERGCLHPDNSKMRASPTRVSKRNALSILPGYWRSRFAIAESPPTGCFGRTDQRWDRGIRRASWEASVTKGPREPGR